MSSRAAQSAVERILDSLTDRRGFRQVWDNIDEEIQIEIRNEWREIIDDEFDKFRALERS